MTSLVSDSCFAIELVSDGRRFALRILDCIGELGAEMSSEAGISSVEDPPSSSKQHLFKNCSSTP
jgi:hypothetical protein